MKKLILFFYFAFALLFGGHTVSVVIPCYYKHVPLLLPLLAELSKQTVLPQEVVISISEINRASTNDLKQLGQSRYLFPVRIIKTDSRLLPGENRNVACQQVKGDIVITQDADDMPHPQRIEIIKHFFACYDIDVLLHRWIPDVTCKSTEGKYWGSHNLNMIPHLLVKDWSDALTYPDVHYGNMAMKRKVCQEVRWPKLFIEEDTYFNIVAYKKFRKTMIIDACLIVYRQQFSSCLDPENIKK